MNIKEVFKLFLLFPMRALNVTLIAEKNEILWIHGDVCYLHTVMDYRGKQWSRLK